MHYDYIGREPESIYLYAMKKKESVSIKISITHM